MKNPRSLGVQIIIFYDIIIKRKVKFSVLTAQFVLQLHHLAKKYWDRQKCVPRYAITHLVTWQQC